MSKTKQNHVHKKIEKNAELEVNFFVLLSQLIYMLLPCDFLNLNTLFWVRPISGPSTLMTLGTRNFRRGSKGLPVTCGI